MSFPRYPAYKNSGVEWLGEVPEHWEVASLKRVLSEPLMYGANEPSNDEVVDGPRFIRITDIDSGNKLRADTFRSLSNDTAKPYLLEEGDILLARSGATVGKSFIYENVMGPCCFAGYLIKAKSDKNKISYWFLYDFFQSDFFWVHIRSEQIQSTIQNVSAERYAKLFVPLPPLPEQHTIAAFLDRETAKIDALVAEQETLIALLAEKRQATISHAVTKGLTPAVPMKESGIEWLGAVPDHWEIALVKNIASCNDETLSEDTTSDFDIEYIEISDVDFFAGIKGTTPLTFGNAPSRARRRVRHGDVIVSTVRTYLRAIAPIITPPENLIASTGFAVIRPRAIEAKFLSYLFRTEYLISEIVAKSVGVSYPAINANELMGLKLALPPLAEQQAIVAHLDRETARLDALTVEARRAIDLLKERRSALISAAVTGKIDVRGTTMQEAL